MDKELVGAVQHKMDNQSKATPRPWKVCKERHWDNGNLIIQDSDNFHIAYVNQYASKFKDKKDEINASLIIKAVNNHEALLEACREALKKMEHWNSCGMDLSMRPDEDSPCICPIKILSQAIANATK